MQNTTVEIRGVLQPWFELLADSTSYAYNDQYTLYLIVPLLRSCSLLVQHVNIPIQIASKLCLTLVDKISLEAFYRTQIVATLQK